MGRNVYKGRCGAGSGIPNISSAAVFAERTIPQALLFLGKLLDKRDTGFEIAHSAVHHLSYGLARARPRPAVGAGQA